MINSNKSSSMRMGHVHTSMLSNQKKEGKFGNVLALLLPVLGLLTFDLVGQLFAHEIILIILFPILLLKHSNLLNQKFVKIIFFFGLMWLAAQILTDIIQEIPFEDFSRGWAKIFFFLISFASLVMLLNTQLRIYLWLMGSIVPMFLRPFQLFEHDLDPLILWKFGIGSSILFAACLPYLYRLLKNDNDVKAIRRIALLHLAIGFISFFLNARSLAGLTITTGLLIWFYPKYRNTNLGIGKVIISIATVALVSFALIKIYSFGAGNGYFGDEARDKYDSQVMYGGGVIDIIMGGRAEGLVSTVAIADSPIIGHGSWAKDYHYLALYIELRARNSEVNTNELKDEVANGLIPSHSYLLGAWVEAGVVGAFFWFTVIYLMMIYVIPISVQLGNWLGLVIITISLSFFWNILFSPFGANARVDTAGILAIFSLLIYQSKFQIKSKKRELLE